MVSGFRPNSPPQIGKYSISFDNSKLEVLVIGDNNTENDYRSGNSTPSQEVSQSVITASRRLRREYQHDSEQSFKRQ